MRTRDASPGLWATTLHNRAGTLLRLYRLTGDRDALDAAIAAWEESAYDLVLLDWHMPGLDGLEVVRRIRSLEGKLARPRTAVLIVTGRIAEADRAACFAAGADECVAKPFTPDELLDALDRALQGGALS